MRTDLKHALKSSAPEGHGDESTKSPSTKSRSEMAGKSTSSSAGDGDDEDDDVSSLHTDQRVTEVYVFDCCKIVSSFLRLWVTLCKCQVVLS